MMKVQEAKKKKKKLEEKIEKMVSDFSMETDITITSLDFTRVKISPFICLDKKYIYTISIDVSL